MAGPECEQRYLTIHNSEGAAGPEQGLVVSLPAALQERGGKKNSRASASVFECPWARQRFGPSFVGSKRRQWDRNRANEYLFPRCYSQPAEKVELERGRS